MNETNKTLRSSKLVRISSLDRDDAKTSNQYDFKISFNDSDLNQVKRVVLKSVIIPNSYHNVNSTNNVIDYDGGSSITLDIGQYSLSELITEIESKFSAINILTITQDAKTKKLSFAFTSPIILDDTSTAKRLLGWEDTQASSATHNLPNLPDLSGLKKVFIKSNKLSNATSMADSSKKKYNIFTEIDITVPFGFIEHRVMEHLQNQDELTFSQPKSITNIDIKLFDQHLNELDLNGHHFEIILKVFHL